MSPSHSARMFSRPAVRPSSASRRSSSSHPQTHTACTLSLSSLFSLFKTTTTTITAATRRAQHSGIGPHSQRSPATRAGAHAYTKPRLIHTYRQTSRSRGSRKKSLWPALLRGSNLKTARLGLAKNLARAQRKQKECRAWHQIFSLSNPSKSSLAYHGGGWKAPTAPPQPDGLA